MKKLLITVFLLFLLIIPAKAYAINEVNVYFFYNDECSICKQEKVYLDALKQRYPNMRIYSYETSDSSNEKIMNQAKELFSIKEKGVPFTVVGDTSILGFSQSKKAIVQRNVYNYSLKKYENKLGNLLNIGYSTELTGTVEEYKDNDQYVIEEQSNNPPTPLKKTIDKKYQASFILVSIGVVLGFIAFILYRVEKKGRL